MINIDWTILVQIVGFLILIFALNLVLYKPIRSILRQRKTKMEGLTQSIDTTAEEAQNKNQAFDDGIKNARLKGQKEKEAMMEAAAEEERSMIADINAKAKAELERVKTQITKDAEMVKQELEKDVDSFAATITQKILGRAA